MTVAILTLCAALVPFVIWLIKRRAANQADPLTRHADRQQKFEADLAAQDSIRLSAGAADDLDALERLDVQDRARH